MKRLFIAIMAMIVISSCTDNRMAKEFGGSAKLELPANTKLVNVTWKGDNIWYLMRPMGKDEKPETYVFREESSWDVFEGTYFIVESKQ